MCQCSVDTQSTQSKPLVYASVWLVERQCCLYVHIFLTPLVSFHFSVSVTLLLRLTKQYLSFLPLMIQVWQTKAWMRYDLKIGYPRRHLFSSLVLPLKVPNLLFFSTSLLEIITFTLKSSKPLKVKTKPHSGRMFTLTPETLSLFITLGFRVLTSSIKT